MTVSELSIFVRKSEQLINWQHEKSLVDLFVQSGKVHSREFAGAKDVRLEKTDYQELWREKIDYQLIRLLFFIATNAVGFK